MSSHLLMTFMQKLEVISLNRVVEKLLCGRTEYFKYPFKLSCSESLLECD